MGYDRGDSFPFYFEPNGIPFGLENRKENCHCTIISHSMWKEVEIYSYCISKTDRKTHGGKENFMNCIPSLEGLGCISQKPSRIHNA